MVDFFRTTMPDSENSRDPPLLILGASTRAAAQSAIRAGLRPICADLFADLDLRACARVLEVAEYPRGLVAAAAAAPCGPWMYTGGLENHPGLVARISRSRPLWGNGPDVLRRIRDPWHVQEILLPMDLPALRVWPEHDAPPPADGRWMLKPRHGAAGRGIRVWEGRGADCAALTEAGYFQERRAGVPVSALYLATPQHTHLLGTTRQLVGLEEVHAPSFAWCGTITPVRFPDHIIATIRRIGECLGLQGGLRGLFGCDFLVDDEHPWLTEVNPRYPASTELLEHALRVPILDWHRQACEGFLESSRTFALPPSFAAPPLGGTARKPPEGGTTSSAILGKIVMYAPRDLNAPDGTRFVSHPSSWMEGRRARDVSLPCLADIPLPGQRIERGQPVCTFYARGRSVADCLATLFRRAARFESQCK